MRKRHTRFLISLLTLAMCLASLCITPALAYSDPSVDEAPPPAAIETTPDPEPSKAPAKAEGALSEGSGLVTRDLLYDKATNKQFITVQDKDGNIFYIIIDYDAPVNEDEEQYQTYFLSPVSVSELNGLADNGNEAPVVCNCTEKCAVGAVNTNCPLCATNMTECAGEAPEPVEDPTPSEDPAAEPVTEPKPETASGFNPALLIVLVLALAAGGVIAYIKVIRPKQQAQNTNDPDEGDEDDFWDDEDESDPFGDSGGNDADNEDYDDDDGGDDGGGTDDGGGET